MQSAVVFNESQLPKLVHEEADSGARGADHLCQSFLTDLSDYRLGFAILPEISQQKQHPDAAGNRLVCCRILHGDKAGRINRN